MPGTYHILHAQATYRRRRATRPRNGTTPSSRS